MRLLNLHASTLNNFCWCIQYMHANGRIYHFQGGWNCYSIWTKSGDCILYSYYH